MNARKKGSEMENNEKERTEKRPKISYVGRGAGFKEGRKQE